MAKNTQEAEVIVTMNGQAAKRAVAELTQEFERLQKEALEAYKAGNDALGKKLDAQAQKLTKDIEITRRETKKFADVMKNINGASLKELNSAAKQLRSEINKLTPGTKEFVEKSKQLQQVNSRINQLKGSFKGLVAEEKSATLSLKGLADGFNKYFGMVTAGIAAITGLSMAFRKASQDAAAMDDAYSQVRKTTGLTREEVEQLNDAFKKMDTRTSREELNKMAYEAGKLGFTGVENIRQFVEAADIINVALGDVLGEGATLEIAKLAQVFAQSTAALDNLDLKGRMLAVGSAVNQLGKESTASESYMVEFLGRLGGVATQAGLSADQILGYASALDQMKQKVEMSATAFQKLIQQMIKKPEEFVDAARMPLEDFKKMLETDMNGAIHRVLEGFNEMGGFTELVPLFKDMGLDGARAASVIASLAANLDKVSAAQETANEHIQLGTSMTREYEIMNSSLQAQLEKARKEFKDASETLGKSLNPVMLKSTKAVTYIIKALAAYGKEIKAVVIALVTLTAIIKAQAIAEGIRAVALKISNTLQATGTVLSNKMMAAYYRLTGQTLKLAAAQKAANAAMSTSVIGAIAVAVAALTFAIARYVNKMKEANKELSYFEELERKITHTQAEETAKVTTLTKIVEDQNVAYAERLKALEELKKIIPEYHASLTKEGRLINNNRDAIEAYISSLKSEVRMNIYKEDLTEIVTKIDDAKAALKELMPEYEKYWGLEGYNARPLFPLSSVKAWDAAAQAIAAKVRDAQKVISSLETQEEELMAKIRGQSFVPGSSGNLTNQEENNQFNSPQGTGSAGDNRKKAFDARIKLIQQQYRREEQEAKRALLLEEIDQVEYEQRVREAKVRYFQDKLAAAKKYSQDETEIMNEFYDWQLQQLEKSTKEMNELRDALAAADRARKKKEEEEQLQQMSATQKRLAKEQEILEQDLARVKERIGEDTWKEELAFEMWKLEELHDRGILAERTYQQARLKIVLEYAQKAADQANQISEASYNFVTALKEAESAKLEAEYQAQLTAAGDNAEKREEIENEYEQKQLDLKKKYADTEMAINIAKTVASGAVAAIKAYAEGGPYLGIALAALIAATTAAEVATIIAQRNAIKNTSVSSSSSSSSIETGKRTLTGYSEGGDTPWAASDDTPVGIVHANEWVAPAWMKRREPVLFANLERYRKAGSHGRSGSASRGFADGGNTGNGTHGGNGSKTNRYSDDIYHIVKTAVVDVFESGAVRVVLVRKDLTELDNQNERFKNMTSR